VELGVDEAGTVHEDAHVGADELVSEDVGETLDRGLRREARRGEERRLVSRLCRETAKSQRHTFDVWYDASKNSLSGAWWPVMDDIMRIVPAGCGARFIMWYLRTPSARQRVRLVSVRVRGKVVADGRARTGDVHQTSDVDVHDGRDVVEVLLPEGRVGRERKASLYLLRASTSSLKSKGKDGQTLLTRMSTGEHSSTVLRTNSSVCSRLRRSQTYDHTLPSPAGRPCTDLSSLSWFEPVRTRWAPDWRKALATAKPISPLAPVCGKVAQGDSSELEGPGKKRARRERSCPRRPALPSGRGGRSRRTWRILKDDYAEVHSE